MKKKIIIAIVILAIGGGIAAYFMTSGQYDSKLEKSTVEVAEVAEGETWVNTLKDLSGNYVVVAGENSNAEILFHVEGLKKTIGAFEDFKISLEIGEDYLTSKLNAQIQTSSINTGNSMRDESLAEADFFDIPNYPTISFSSNQIVLSDTGYIAKGELTLMGQTNAIDLPFKHIGSGTDKNNNNFQAFEGEVVFDRTAYGMQSVSGTGDIVTLNFYCELIATEK
tara:strand:+ start:19 stop:690 length:672 start_codon:yes stop_codon:yes gene_type:complete